MAQPVITHVPAPPSAGVFFDPNRLPAGVEHGGRRHLLGLEGLEARSIHALLDAADRWRRRWRDAWSGRFEGRTLAIVGDIAHSRVARSAIFGLVSLGARVRVAGPATLVPREIGVLGCSTAASVEEALDGADGAMALRLQTERM